MLGGFLIKLLKFFLHSPLLVVGQVKFWELMLPDKTNKPHFLKTGFMPAQRNLQILIAS